MINKYLIDNDTLSRMTPAQRASAFVREYCRVPAEVLSEAAGYIEASVSEALDYPVSTEVLDNLRKVMESLEPGDHSVVDLYGNKGSGDAMLLAVALTEIAEVERRNELIPNTWNIATGDTGLSAKSAALGIPTCTDDQFIATVRAADHESGPPVGTNSGRLGTRQAHNHSSDRDLKR